MLKLAKIRQVFPNRRIELLEDEFSVLLSSSRFNEGIRGRKRIAIAVGSRGISNLVMLVKKLVEYLKGVGIEPIIVPAMGSHGCATAEGQEAVLNKLGVSLETVGAEIVSSVDVISLGEVWMEGGEFAVYVDKVSWERTDGVILINRIKPHTDFTGRYESGLVKMATVGLGNHKGAQQVHSLGTAGLKKLMPCLAEVVLGDSKVVGGFATVENAYSQTCGLYWLDRDEILDKEPAVLEQAKALMPKLPVDEIDVLIVKRMGKEISGVGMDPKIIGRLMIWGEEEPASPRIELIGVCDITDESCGNALGVGLADFITRRLFERIDFRAIKENVLTSAFYQRGKVPLVLEDEREVLEVCLRHFERRGEKDAKVIVIKDTLNISDMYVSESVLSQLKDRDDIEVVSGPAAVAFDSSNRMVLEL
jgi:hypothetical protein